MYKFSNYQLLALMLDSLVRVSRRVEFKKITIPLRKQEQLSVNKM